MRKTYQVYRISSRSSCVRQPIMLTLIRLRFYRMYLVYCRSTCIAIYMSVSKCVSTEFSLTRMRNRHGDSACWTAMGAESSCEKLNGQEGGHHRVFGTKKAKKPNIIKAKSKVKKKLPLHPWSIDRSGNNNFPGRKFGARMAAREARELPRAASEGTNITVNESIV